MKNRVWILLWGGGCRLKADLQIGWLWNPADAGSGSTSVIGGEEETHLKERLK